MLRCLPYFYLAGVKKSGTTDLWGHITEHPDVVTVGKELQWFARGRFSKNYTVLVKRRPPHIGVCEYERRIPSCNARIQRGGGGQGFQSP